MPGWMDRSYLDDLAEENRTIRAGREDRPDPPDPSEYADDDGR